jgi:hypothetical protein
VTSPAPFQPIGLEPRWKLLYTELQPLAVGDVLVYARMGEVLDLDPGDDRERGKILGALQRARRELLLRDARAVEMVRRVGARIAEPERHLVIAGAHSRKSRRALRRGTDHVEHVDWAALDANTRLAFESQGRVNRFLIEAQIRLEREQAKMRGTIEQVSVAQERTAEELARLHERMRRLEGSDSDTD